MRDKKFEQLLKAARAADKAFAEASAKHKETTEVQRVSFQVRTDASISARKAAEELQEYVASLYNPNRHSYQY